MQHRDELRAKEILLGLQKKVEKEVEVEKKKT